MYVKYLRLAFYNPFNLLGVGFLRFNTETPGPCDSQTQSAGARTLAVSGPGGRQRGGRVWVGQQWEARSGCACSHPIQANTETSCLQMRAPVYMRLHPNFLAPLSLTGINWAVLECFLPCRWRQEQCCLPRWREEQFQCRVRGLSGMCAPWSPHTQSLGCTVWTE